MKYDHRKVHSHGSNPMVWFDEIRPVEKRL